MQKEIHEIRMMPVPPVSIGSLDEAGLEVALKSNPFSAALHIVKAIQYHENQDVRFEEVLKKAAAYTISRSHLRFILEGPVSIQFEWNPVEMVPEETEASNQNSEEEFFQISVENLEDIGNVSAPQPEEEILFADSPETETESDFAVEIPEELVAGSAIHPPKANGFGFSFVRIKAGSKKSTPKTSFDIREVEPKKKSKVKKPQDTVIERFLEASPSISSPRIDFGSKDPQPDLSVTSTQLDEEIVTENMALIYLRQRNFEKALEIYRRLQLKFPEKSAFFAALIKNIENTIV